MNDVAKRIYDEIYEKQISYAELSKLTGISKSALQRYATGETAKMPLPRLEAIANALEVSAAYLMGWEDKAGNNMLPKSKATAIDSARQALIDELMKCSDEELQAMIKIKEMMGGK